MGNSLIDPLQLIIVLLIVGLVLAAGRFWVTPPDKRQVPHDE